MSASAGVNAELEMPSSNVSPTGGTGEPLLPNPSKHLAETTVHEYYKKVKDGTFATWWQCRVNGFVLDKTPGMGAHKGKLAGYSPASLQYPPFIPMMVVFNKDATVLTALGRHHMQAFVFAVLSLAVALSWGKSTEWEVSSKIVALMSANISRLTAFVIGGFVSINVTRWYQRRLYYIALIGNLKAFIVLTGSMLDVPITMQAGPQRDELALQAQSARRTLGRWCCLAFELAILKCRNQMDTPEARQWLEEKGLLSGLDGNEWDLMVPGARQLTVVSWMGRMLRQCDEKGLLCKHSIEQFMHLLERARSNSSDMMDRTILDIPYAYSHMVTFLVKTTLLFSTLDIGITASTHGKGTSITNYVFLFICVMTLNCGYQGLMDLHIHLHNPFGYRTDDIPHEFLSGGLKKLADGIIKNADTTDLSFDGVFSVRPAIPVIKELPTHSHTTGASPPLN
mmetsp:Transcript_19497/g.38624  ORF Transcript_19497/g.38624 Transcript_19497/m.38624 type:complete len:453 (+) Transcript_19497:108-1466(+)